MTLTADNVRVGVTGAAYVAPIGTPLPTNAAANLAGPFDDVGYISDDGITQSIGSDRTEIKAWQNADIVRKVQTSHDLTFQFTMIETSDTTLAVYYGNYLAGTVEITSDELDRQSWVLNVVDGADHIRIVIPEAEVTDRGDVVYKSDDAVSYPITLTAFPDTAGVKAYLYLIDAS